jgi:hypothetical protein
VLSREVEVGTGAVVDVLLECGSTLVGPTPDMVRSTPLGPMAVILSGVFKKARLRDGDLLVLEVVVDVRAAKESLS